MQFSRRLGTLVLVAGMGIAGLGQVPAAAVEQPGGRLVDVTPSTRTPHVLDGRVNSVTQVGDRMLLGGSFSQAREHNSTTVLSRTNLLAFDSRDGSIDTSFVPQPNGQVQVVLPAGDGESVFVGGKFTRIGDQARKNVARVRVSDGAVLPFDAGKVSGQVKDLRLVGGRLWLAGQFTHVGGREQSFLATVDPRTGAPLPYMGLRLDGTHNGGYPQVMKMDVSPDGRHLAAVGNFRTVDGQVRRQLVQLDLTGAAARLDDFSTGFYSDTCSRSFDAYVRDVDYSPDGEFFVVTTTGAYGGADSPCDTSSRFETGAGAGAEPSWVNYTGGDTLHGVEVTDSVVYVGGHFRWQNNPYGRDAVGPGAVAAEGIAALDPSNGLPYDWNPTRTRGVGVFDFHVNDDGLWLASDTDRIGTGYYYRARIANLPADGVEFPPVRSATLPNDVYKVASLNVTARSLRNGTAGPERSVSGLSSLSVRGAFMVNGYLYLAQSNGTFVRRSFDGSSFGPVESVDAADRLARNTTWRDDLRWITGMFYEDGRIYYTRSGSSQLHYRYFTPQSGVVGAKRLTASSSIAGLSFSGVRGMFHADGRLFWSDSGGTLRSIAWRDQGPSGAPVAGTVQVVSGPGVDRVSWSSRDLFLFQDPAGRGAVMEPEAAFTQDCESLTCTFDASGSVAPGGTVRSYAWTFGDGRTGTGRTPEHSYAAAGRYTVTLEVTTDRGQVASTSRQVVVERVNRPPTAAFTATCNGLECDFDASGSSDPDGPLTYRWDFGDGSSATGVRTSHRYAAEGERAVTLTVTDTDGVSESTTRQVTLALARVEPVAASSANANTSVHRVRVPAEVEDGDLLLLHLAVNRDVAMSAPAGWEPLESVSGRGAAGGLWSRRADASDAGSLVSVELADISKGDATVVAYRGLGGRRAVVRAHAGLVDSSTTTEHGSPEVQVPGAGGWLVTYWASKSSAATEWTDVAGQVRRSGSVGVGGGRIAAVVTDSGTALPAGPAGGLTGTTSTGVGRALVFSTVVGLE